jgi:hypothetical protein
VAGFGGNSTRLLFVSDGVFSEETPPLVVQTTVAAVLFSKPPTKVSFRSSNDVKTLTVIQVVDRYGSTVLHAVITLGYQLVSQLRCRNHAIIPGTEKGSSASECPTST